MANVTWKAFAPDYKNDNVSETQNVVPKEDIHKEICLELNNMYKSKNHDYGNSFSETFQKLGMISAVTRISDKCNRLISLCKLPQDEQKVKDESIQDTLLDMANYCILTAMEIRGNKNEQS